MNWRNLLNYLKISIRFGPPNKKQLHGDVLRTMFHGHPSKEERHEHHREGETIIRR